MTYTRVSPFLDRLATTLPGWPDDLPAEWQRFRAQVEERVAEGETLYGVRFRGRDNCDDGVEEAADLVAYPAFDVIVEGEDDIDLALTAAWHAYHAACALWLRKAKRRGTTGPGFGSEG